MDKIKSEDMVEVHVSLQGIAQPDAFVCDESGYLFFFLLSPCSTVDDNAFATIVPNDITILPKRIYLELTNLYHSGRYTTFLVLKYSSLK